ncbi:MAG TPA: hypothetical protein VLF59_05115 [Candidatus Saccharimonadales bacterium]|nr:hypothetical protein [Candidatus Saccharimonadales bacterium]
MIQQFLSIVKKLKPYVLRRPFQVGTVVVVLLAAGIVAAFSRTPATIHTEQTAQHQKNTAQHATSTTTNEAAAQTDNPQSTSPSHPTTVGTSTATPNSSPSGAHSLAISPAAITIYKMPGTPIQGARFNEKSVDKFTIAAADGKPINYPRPDDISPGFFSSNGSPTYQAAWNMSVGAFYLSLGTHTYTFSAKAQNGQAYTGSIQITALAAPYFSTTTSPLSTNATPGQTDFAFTAFQGDFSHINENDIDVYVTGDQNISVSEITLYEDEIDLTTAAPYTGYFTIVLESAFQHVEIPAHIIAPY